MDDKLKNENDILDELFEEKEKEEPEAAEQLTDEEAFEFIAADEVDLFLKDEDIEKLTDDEINLYCQAIEIALEKYDDALMLKGEEIYTYEEFKQLKQIEKKLYKTLKNRNKVEKKGIFDHLKIWMAVYCILFVIINIFPINPFLPANIYAALYEKLPRFLQTDSGLTIFMAIYSVVLIIPGYVIWLFLKKDTPEKMKSKKIFLFINFIITFFVIAGAIVYLWLVR